MANEHDNVLQSVDALVSEIETMSGLVLQVVSAKTNAEQNYQDIEAKLEQSRNQVATIVQTLQEALGHATTGPGFQPSGQ